MNPDPEILDDSIEDHQENGRQITRILVLSASTIVGLLLLELFRDWVPRYLVDWNDIQVMTMGLILIIVVIILSLLIPKYLNKMIPEFSIIQIIGLTGVAVFVIDVVFKLIQNMVILGYGFNLDYLGILRSGLTLGFISMLFANIRIHKLRNQKTLFPILLLIILWFSFGLLIKHYSG